MTIPRYQAASAFKAGTGALTVPWPSHMAGDVALLVAENANEAIALDSAQGFVLITSVGTGTGGAVNSTKLSLWWKRATTGSEAAPIVGDGGDHAIAQIFTFRGCVDTGNPWDVFASDVDTSTSATAITFPSVTTTVADCLIVNILGTGQTAGAPLISGWTNGALSSETERADMATGFGNGGSLALATGGKATAGATGTTTAVLAHGDKQARITIALKASTASSVTTPFFVNDGSLTGLGGAVTPAWPSGHQAGDIGIMFVETAGTENIGALPTGWAHAPNSPVSVGTTSTGSTLSVLWKRAVSSSEAALSIGDSGNHNIAQIIVYRGCVGSGSPWDVTTSDTLGTASTSVTIPGVTTVTANCLIIGAVAMPTDTLTGQIQSDVFTNGGLTAVTKRFNSWDDAGNGGGFGVFEGVKAVAGATGNTTATSLTSALQARWCGALKGASSGTPGPDPTGDINKPHRYWRMLLTNTPGAGPECNEVEWVTRQGTAGMLNSLLTKPTAMHPGVTHIRPVIVCNKGNTDGVFDVDFMLITIPAGYSPDKFTDEVRRRNDTIYYRDGSLREGVVAFDGATGLPILKGVQRGSGRNTDPVVFDPVYQNVPKVTITGGFATQPESKWGTAAAVDANTASSAPTANVAQIPDCSAGALTPSGFTIRARLSQRGTETLRTHSFPANTLDVIDESVEVTVANAPSHDDNYTVSYHGQCVFASSTGNEFTVTLQFAIQSNDGSGWVTRSIDQLSFTTTNPVFASQFSNTIGRGINAPGMDTTDKIRVKLLKILRSGVGTIFNTSVTADAVIYLTSSDTFASKTGTASYYPSCVVDWESVGYI